MHLLLRNNLALLLIATLLSAMLAAGCGPSEQTLREVDFAPQERDDWENSTPEEEGLDPLLVARMYYDAARKLDTIYGLLVIKNGRLIAEDYWHGSNIDKKHAVQSVTKSYVSALVGIAIDQGIIDGVDQKMMDFFPEFVDDIEDDRKFDITIRHLLQMRAGYGWEEANEASARILWKEGFHVYHLVDFPLVRDPGSGMEYSNLSSHILGIIVARAAGEVDLLEYGREHLFSKIDSEPGDWLWMWENYRGGAGSVEFRARDAAKFGEMYLDGGVFRGERVLPEAWVEDSLETYSTDAWPFRVGKNFKEIGYGYQWWSARSGDHRYNLAWGHGGQLIFVLHDLDMVVVVLADPFMGESDGSTWKHEKRNINLVADFIEEIP